MSRTDVMKSLLRSAASGASTQLLRVASLRKHVSAFMQRRLMLSDSKLTAAVARAPDVSAATVTSRAGQLHVDASFRDGSNLLVHLTSLKTTFAPRGVKEWSMRTDPENAAYDPRCADIVAALASEVARTLWGPFLRGRAVTPGRNALAHRDGTVLVVDLRTVPEVRSALGQPLLAAAIEAFGLSSIDVYEGGLQLVPNVRGVQP
jgi:hypothetical protein